MGLLDCDYGVLVEVTTGDANELRFHACASAQTEKASLEASLEAARAELQVRADVVADLNAQREADAAACKRAKRSVRELEEANAELERRRDSLVRALDDMQGSHMKVVKAKLDSVFVRAFPNEVRKRLRDASRRRMRYDGERPGPVRWISPACTERGTLCQQERTVSSIRFV